MAGLLCCLLVFPLICQSLHIPVHQHHPEHRPDSSCHSRLGPPAETCLLCEHEFTSFTSSPDPNHQDKCPVRDRYGHSIIPMACSHFSGTDSCLRAPPVRG